MSRKSSQDWHFEGFSDPTHTQTPNALFDEVLPKIDSFSELKVLMAIIRKTFGWHKDEDLLSLSQLVDLTGLSRQGVIDGILLGIEHGLIYRREHGLGYIYGLTLVSKVDQGVTGSQQIRPEVVNNVDQGSQRCRPEVVNVVDTQKKGNKELNKKKERIGADRAATTPSDKTTEQPKALPLNSTKPLDRPITPAPKPAAKPEPKRPVKDPDPVEVSDEAREAYEHARAKFGGKVPKGLKLAWLDNRIQQFGLKCVLASITRGEERSVEVAQQISAIMERMTPQELKQYDEKGNRAGRAPVPISTNQRYQQPQKAACSALDYVGVDLYGIGS